jgi:hypothetical protein
LLSEILPQAGFIWLIRDGRAVVASTVGRGWFDDHELEGVPPEKYMKRQWKTHRLNGALCGALSGEEWRQMSVFERNCWYWAYSSPHK